MVEASFGEGSGRLRFDADGVVTALRATARPELSLLERAGEPVVRTGGRVLAWGSAEVGRDVDELEVTRSGPGGLRVTVRHTFEPVWTVRLLLVHLGAVPVDLDEVTLSWRPAAGCRAVALAAGVEAAYAVQPADGRGPVLVGQLTGGLQTGVDPTGLGLGPVRLEPGARRVAQWRWRLARAPRQAARPGQLPRSTWLDVDQTVSLAATPDVAVVAGGLTVETEPDAVELSAPEPGAYRVELRSARGTVGLDLDCAPPLEALVDRAAEEAVAVPPGKRVRLTGGAAGIVAQEALARQRFDDPDPVEDALDLLAGTLSEGSAPDPLDLAFLAREAERTGDRFLLERAEAGVLAAPAAAPGLGLAATRVLLGGMEAGRSPAPLVAHLATLAAGVAEPAAAGLPEVAAGLELLLLTRRRSPDPERTPRSGPLAAALRRVGAELGAGLPGRRLPDPTGGVPVDVLGHLAAVLTLVPEEGGDDLSGWWGVPPSEVGRAAAAEARVRLARSGPAAGADRALAWLVLRAALG